MWNTFQCDMYDDSGQFGSYICVIKLCVITVEKEPLLLTAWRSYV